MATPFKKRKINGITYTSYTDGRPTTWSQSFGGGSYRQTLTHRGGHITQTITTKNCGYTKIEKKVLTKKNKPLKYKPPKPYKFKYGKPVRARKPRVKAMSYELSSKILFYMMVFAFLPMIIHAIANIF